MGQHTLGKIALAAALALSYESYARSNASGTPGRGHEKSFSRDETEEARGTGGSSGISAGKAAQDDPEFLRNDSSTVGNATSAPGDEESQRLHTTYDASRDGIAGSQSTSTDTSTNRSSAGQTDEGL